MQIIGQLIQTLIIFNLVKQSLRLEFFVVLCVTVIKYFTWMTAGNGVFGNVFDHHTPRLNNRTLTNCDSTQNNHATAEPHLIFDCNIFVDVGIVVWDFRASIKIVVLTNHQTFWPRMEIITYNNFTPPHNKHTVKIDIITQKSIPRDGGFAIDL